MSAKIIPIKNKIRISIVGIILFIALSSISNAFDLNFKAQRLLSKILEIPEKFFYQTMDQYQRLQNEEVAKLKKEIINLQDLVYEKDLKIKSLENSNPYYNYENLNNSNSDIYISSFDQVNFNCCNQHRVFITNPSEFENGVYAVSHGDFVIGKTRRISKNEIEVRLLSDPEEYISLKTAKDFFCIAKGKGEGSIITCLNESKAVAYEIGDTFYTTGFDGIYPEGLIVGYLANINDIENNFFLQEIEIELFFDPFKSMNRKAYLHE